MRIVLEVSAVAFDEISVIIKTETLTYMRELVQAV